MKTKRKINSSNRPAEDLNISVIIHRLFNKYIQEVKVVQIVKTLKLQGKQDTCQF